MDVNTNCRTKRLRIQPYDRFMRWRSYCNYIFTAIEFPQSLVHGQKYTGSPWLIKCIYQPRIVPS